MELDNTGALMDKIGRLLGEDKEYPLDGTLLYARLDTNMISISIFKDRGNHVLYCRPDYDRLQDTLFELWELEKRGKRWAEMEYVVRDGRFDAAFVYPEEIDSEEEPLDRRDRIVKRHFGDKPIAYPPWPFEDQESFEL